MRHPLRRVSLQAWLVAAFVAVGMVASIAVLVVLLPRLEPSVKQQQQDRSFQAARAVVLRHASSDLGGFFSQADAQTFVRGISGDLPGKVEAALFHRDGNRWKGDAFARNGFSTDFPTDEISAPARTAGTTGQAVSLPAADGTLLRVVIPIPLDPLTTDLLDGAVAQVDLELPDLNRQVAILRTRVLLAVTAVLALASLVGLVISRLLAHRIGRLASTASTLAGGDLAARAPDTSPRELAELSGGLNRMAGRLAELVDTTTSERDRIRDLVVSLEEGVVAVAPDGELTVTNPAAAGYLGDQIAADDASLDDLPGALPEQIRGLLADPSSEAEIEAITLADGRVLTVNASRLARTSGVVLTLHDVTHQRRLERARRDLIANVSHELKTPLTALKGFLELLEDERMSDVHRREFLDRMSQEAERLERLVVEQLELARLDSGALPLEPSHVDLLELAEGVVESRYLLFAREGVGLACAIASQGPFVANIDPARVEQILLILLDNALRHTSEGGRVDLRVSRSDGSLHLAVCDTGEGIPEDAQPFVFDRFYRADQSREGRGTGLGLAIARGLAEAHGGGIDLDSTPGVGSTFTLRLPALVNDMADMSTETFAQ